MIEDPEYWQEEAPKKKWLVPAQIGFIVLLGIAAVIFYTNFYKTHNLPEDKAKAEPKEEIIPEWGITLKEARKIAESRADSIKVLHKDYQENVIAADERWKGGKSDYDFRVTNGDDTVYCFWLTAKVSGFDKDDQDRPVLLLETGEEGKEAYALFHNFEKQELARLKKGQTILFAMMKVDRWFMQRIRLECLLFPEKINSTNQVENWGKALNIL